MPPSGCIPNPATCAVASEAFRNKVSLHVSPAAPQVQGKHVLSENLATRELFRHAEIMLTNSMICCPKDRIIKRTDFVAFGEFSFDKKF